MTVLASNGFGSYNFGMYGAAGQSKDMKVTGVSGNAVTLKPALMFKCPSGKQAELRRHASGIKEFVGDITGKSGNKYTLDYGTLSGRPKVGETVYIYCGGSGGSSSSKKDDSSSSDLSSSSIFPGEEGMGIPVWVWVIGGALLLAIVLKK